MSVKTIINPDTGKREDKPEYPLVAVREVILNALVHRDYSIYTDNSPIRIVLYKNRLEVENPGGLYGRITVRELGNKPADTRNPFIAGALEVVINSENRYSGIPTIRKAMAKAELPPPAFYNERGNFKVVLYNERKTTSLVDDGEIRQRTDLLDYCRVPRSRQEIADFYGVKKTTYFMNKYVNPLVEQGVLQLTLREHPKSKHQKYYCP
jgi:ATP-dependent DNA helicase RecG